MMRFARLAAPLATILLVMATNASAVERPDRPDFDNLRIDGSGTDDHLELAKYTDGGRRLDGWVECRTVDGDVTVEIRGGLFGPDKLTYSRNAITLKQGASLRVALNYSSPALSFTKTSVYVESCKGSWSLQDKDSNGSFFDAVDVGAFKLSCGKDLPAALALSESETAALVAATGGKYECKGKGVPEVACFRGDTLVATERGARSIRDLKVGDQVWSWNESMGKKVLSRVSRT